MTQTIGQSFDASVSYYDNWMRIALPNFDEIFSVAVDLISYGADDPISVLDLGAGTGLFSWQVFEKYPAARFTLVDLAPKMLDVARKRLAGHAGQFLFRVEDYRHLASETPFDLILSSLSIHHLSDPEKAELFQRIYQLLKPGGRFVHIDQVKGPSDYWQKFYWEHWLQQVRRKGAEEDQIAASIARRQTYDQEATLGDQLLWLQQAGFSEADCVYKHSFIGVFCAIKI